MDNKDNSENYKANILIGNFQTPIGQSFDNRKVTNNKSNPIYKKMFKYIHNNLSNNKFSKPLKGFNPDDLI
jgi:hypothetical protein